MKPINKFNSATKKLNQLNCLTELKVELNVKNHGVCVLTTPLPQDLRFTSIDLRRVKSASSMPNDFSFPIFFSLDILQDVQAF